MTKNFILSALIILTAQTIVFAAQAEVQECAIYATQWKRSGMTSYPLFAVYRSKNLSKYTSQASVGETSPSKALKDMQKLIAQGMCVNLTPKLNCTIEPQVIETTMSLFKKKFTVKEKTTYYVSRGNGRRYSTSHEASPYRSSLEKAQQDLAELRKVGMCQ